MRMIRSLLAISALLTAWLLVACADVPARPDAASATSGITVYGTADGGIGRTSR